MLICSFYTWDIKHRLGYMCGNNHEGQCYLFSCLIYFNKHWMPFVRMDANEKIKKALSLPYWLLIRLWLRRMAQTGNGAILVLNMIVSITVEKSTGANKFIMGGWLDLFWEGWGSVQECFLERWHLIYELLGGISEYKSVWDDNLVGSKVRY